MRADSVSCYGNSIVKMPNFDRLASEGVRFDKCFVQHPVCSPSRCSLMTGWYPHVRGHRSLWNLLREDEPSLFKYLKDAGYCVEMYGKNDVFSPVHLTMALEKYKDKDYREKFSAGTILENSPNNCIKSGQSEAEFLSFLQPEQTCGSEDTQDMQNVTKALKFLRNHKKGDKPFIVFLPLSNPHPPYMVPEEFYNMYSPDDIPELLPAEVSGKPDFYSLIRKYRKLEELPDSHFKKIMAVYLGSNSYVDWMLGKLIDTLEESGLADDTTVIVSSDHGDWAGDYGLVEKWPSALDDKIVRVPLIISSPGNKAGHVVNEQVELFDIMATVLELSSIKAQHTHFAKSLVPQLNGASGDPERAVFAEGGYDIQEPNCFEGYENRIYDDIAKLDGNYYTPKGKQQQERPESICRSAMVRTLDYKLIRRTNGVSELYNMQKDQNEIDNLYYNEAFADIRSDMETKMLEWYIKTADVTPWDEHTRGWQK